ncbi:GTPase ObgE [Candidatus Parcubacteria bacterium]|nr:GTPase ObgE [Candidatus Parcubacteria bacterium]
MAFIDELKIHIKAGNGGSGVVRWRQEKGKDKAGAAGGNGGRGGHIYVQAVRDLAIFRKYKHIKEIVAENAGGGMKNSMHGKDGKDLVVEMPIGSVLTNLVNGKKYNLLKDGEKIMILEGGRGGLGNEHFKASTNVRPKEFTGGKEGDSADFYIELELVADLGLAGFPNAGKSSLLNALTNAKAAVGSYEFTTLEPNLGDMYGFIIADIPGLIEGASQGRGLGHKFLRHIKRTKMILHCISLENEDVVKAYKTIRKELSDYNKELADKKEIIVLTKTDAVSPEILKSAKKSLTKLNKEILSVSVLDDVSVKILKDSLVKMLSADTL